MQPDINVKRSMIPRILNPITWGLQLVTYLCKGIFACLATSCENTETTINAVFLVTMNQLFG